MASFRSPLLALIQPFQGLEEDLIFRPVRCVLADVLELADALFIHDEHAGNALVHLASAPLRGEEAQAFGDLPLGVDEQGKGRWDVAFFHAEVLRIRCPPQLQPGLSLLVQLVRFGRIFPALDLFELVRVRFHPLLDDVRRVGEDEDDFNVVLYPDLGGLLEIDELSVLVIVDRAPAGLGGESPWEDQHHVLAFEARQGERPALIGRQREIRHRLADGHGLEISALGKEERAGQGQRQPSEPEDKEWRLLHVILLLSVQFRFKLGFEIFI